MLQSLKRYSGLALLCLSTHAIAANTSLDARLEALHSMKADFTQTIEDNHGKVVQTSYGTMAMQRPGKFRWEIKKPIPQLIVANGKKLWIFDPDLEQVTIRALHQATGESPALMLSQENNSISADYTVKESKKNGSTLNWYLLIPRSEDSNFESVEMGFSGNELQQMTLKDHLGHSTVVAFKRSQTNINLPESLFVFKQGANIDVIDETKHK